jgi:hypothetical protein
MVVANDMLRTQECEEYLHNFSENDTFITFFFQESN